MRFIELRYDGSETHRLLISRNTTDHFGCCLCPLCGRDLEQESAVGLTLFPRASEDREEFLRSTNICANCASDFPTEESN